jgi:hypothetical protein
MLSDVVLSHFRLDVDQGGCDIWQRRTTPAAAFIARYCLIRLRGGRLHVASFSPCFWYDVGSPSMYDGLVQTDCSCKLK